MNLKELQKTSSNHRKEIEAAANCGCFYCLTRFKPALISEWIDKDQTALCPVCGIDAVLVYPGHQELEEMQKHWFGKKEEFDPESDPESNPELDEKISEASAKHDKPDKE